MAYVDQAKKKRIVEEVKKVLPKGWKATFGVDNHMSFVMTIREAPASVLDDVIGEKRSDGGPSVNEYHLAKCFKGKTLVIMQKIKAAVNCENFDNSDPMTDYFHVGYYTSIRFGTHEKPCVFVPTKAKRICNTVIQQDIAPTNVLAFPKTQSEPTEAEKREIAEKEMTRRIIAEMKDTAVALVVSEDALGVLAKAALKAIRS